MTRTSQQIAEAVEALGYDIFTTPRGFNVHHENGSSLNVTASRMGWMVNVGETTSIVSNDLPVATTAAVIAAFAATLEAVTAAAVAEVFPVGTRVRLRRNVERFPHFIAGEGTTGIVVTTDEQFCVRMDDHLPGAEEWENEILWSVIDGDSPSGDLEVIG